MSERRRRRKVLKTRGNLSLEKLNAVCSELVGRVTQVHYCPYVSSGTSFVRGEGSQVASVEGVCTDEYWAVTYWAWEEQAA